MMNKKEKESMRMLIHELEEVVDWTIVENAPLGELELKSIRLMIKMGWSTLNDK